MNQLQKQALSYHDAGLCILPVRYKDKTSKIKWKEYQFKRPTKNEILRWFRNDKLNVAVVNGEVSGGLVCMDFDMIEVYHKWSDQNPGLAQTLPTVITHRGRHVYFRGENGYVRKCPGLEIRNSGYNLLPPSIHPSGTSYSWVDSKLGLKNILDLEFSEMNLIGIIDEEDRVQPKPPSTGTAEVREETNGAGDFDIQEVSGQIEEAISGTMPQKTGERNDRIFDFCRRLHAIPGLRSRPFSELKPLVRQWHKGALEVIRTKFFDETWADFTYKWVRIKFPYGQHTFARVGQILDSPDLIVPGIENYESAPARNLLLVCYILQIINRGDPFYLSCENAGKIIGASKVTASKYFQMFVADGVFEKVRKHTAHKATRYRYVGFELSQVDIDILNNF